MVINMAVSVVYLVAGLDCQLSRIKAQLLIQIDKYVAQDVHCGITVAGLE